jgi:hypothetical protein
MTNSGDDSNGGDEKDNTMDGGKYGDGYTLTSTKVVGSKPSFAATFSQSRI